MFEFLLGYCLGSASNRSECETRYFRETPSRKHTKEEILKSMIHIIIIMTFIATTLFIYLDVLSQTIPIVRFFALTVLTRREAT